MVWNKQESRRKYWATRSSVRSWESEFLMSQNDLVLSHSVVSPNEANAVVDDDSGNGDWEQPNLVIDQVRLSLVAES